MISFKEPLKKWFGHSRRERRATFILLILSVVIAGIRFVLPGRDIEVEFPKDDLSVSAFDTGSYNKIYVKTAGIYTKQKEERTGSRKPRPPLDINKCDSADLEKLPGIGPVLSARIIRYRNLLGGYSSTGQLKEVYGLPPETYQLISGRVFADSAAVRKILINSAGFKEMIRLPYWGKYEVNAILRYRELNGKIRGMKDLIDNKLISSEKALKIRPYLEFSE